MFGRTQGALAAALGLLTWGACSTPTELSDLRPAGPPEVLAVLVADQGPDPANDGLIANGLAADTETTTFCKVGDNKRPSFVNYPFAVGGTQLCPDDLAMGVPELADAEPLAWYVRVEFDELLNPDIEDLIPILDDNGIPTGTANGSLKNTQPVTLTCGATAVPYDGYYGPEGFNLTWPVGPSLFIAPLDSTTIPTGTECSITMKQNIVDKDGNQVPSDEIGPYKFKVAPLTVVGSSGTFPKDPTMPDPQDPTVPLVVGFNAFVGDASVPATAIHITKVASCDATTGTVVAAGVIAEGPAGGDPTAIDIFDSTAVGGLAWTAGLIYLITFDPAAAITDANGGSGALPDPATLSICFGT